MFAFYTYPQTENYKDTSTVKQPDTNGLKLLEEVDVPLKIVKQKKPKIVNHTDTVQTDTAVSYGIPNESLLPIRTEKIKTIPEKPKKIFYEPNTRPVVVEGWQTIILIFTLLLLGFGKAFSSNRFRQTFKALFKYKISQEITREEKVFFHRVNILLTSIHIITISLFLYQLRNYFIFSGEEIFSFIYYFFIICFILLSYFIKYISSTILSYFFDDISISTEYIYNVSLYNNLLGILLIPVLFLSYFSMLEFNFILNYLAIPLFILCFLLRILRIYSIGKIKGISFFYIILYICTLEIVPLVVLIKFFILK